MTLELALSWVLVLFFLMHLTLIFLMWKTIGAQRDTNLSLSKSLSETNLASTQLMSKVVALLSAKDPMSYQAIQAMETYQQETPTTTSLSSFENNDYDEDALLERVTNGDELTEDEYAWLNRRIGGAFEHPTAG